MQVLASDLERVQSIQFQSRITTGAILATPTARNVSDRASGEANLSRDFGISHAGLVEFADAARPIVDFVHDLSLRNTVTPCQRHSVTGFRSNLRMETIGQRVRKARELREVERVDLARAIGLAYSTLADLENGKSRGTTVLHKIAAYLRVRVEWLETGKGQMDAPAAAMGESDWPDVLGYKQSASLGPGAVPDEYAETHKLKFRADSLRKKHLRPDKLGVVYGKGDSMLPRIRSGDAILFDMGDIEPKDGALFVISYKGDLLAKRLVQLGGRWFIESLNQQARDYRKPQPIDEFEHFRIHGRVRWIGSWED